MTKYLQKCLFAAACGLAFATGHSDTAGAQAAATPQSGAGAQRAETPQPRTARPRANAPRRAVRPKPAVQANYDGVWSVLIVTDNGPCDASFRYPIRITRGIVQHAQAAADSFFSIGGQVSRNGGVYVVVSRGGHRADGTGRLAGNGGGGSWQAAGGLCSGRWTAARRG